MQIDRIQFGDKTIPADPLREHDCIDRGVQGITNSRRAHAADVVQIQRGGLDQARARRRATVVQSQSPARSSPDPVGEVHGPRIDHNRATPGKTSDASCIHRWIDNAAVGGERPAHAGREGDLASLRSNSRSGDAGLHQRDISTGVDGHGSKAEGVSKSAFIQFHISSGRDGDASSQDIAKVPRNRAPQQDILASFERGRSDAAIGIDRGKSQSRVIATRREVGGNAFGFEINVLRAFNNLAVDRHGKVADRGHVDVARRRHLHASQCARDIADDQVPGIVHKDAAGGGFSFQVIDRSVEVGSRGANAGGGREGQTGTGAGDEARARNVPGGGGDVHGASASIDISAERDRGRGLQNDLPAARRQLAQRQRARTLRLESDGSAGGCDLVVRIVEDNATRGGGGHAEAPGGRLFHVEQVVHQVLESDQAGRFQDDVRVDCQALESLFRNRVTRDVRITCQNIVASREVGILTTRPGTIDDVKSGWIQKECPVRAPGSAQIDGASKAQILFARNFGESAVAALAAASRGNRSAETGGIVRPHDHFAAVAAGDGIGLDDRVAPHDRALRIPHFRVATSIIATDENRSAAGIAAGVHDRVAEQANAPAEHLDVSAFFASALGRGIEHARVDHRASFGFEEDASAFIHELGGPDRAAVVNGQRVNISPGCFQFSRDRRDGSGVIDADVRSGGRARGDDRQPFGSWLPRISLFQLDLSSRGQTDRLAADGSRVLDRMRN